MNFPGSLSNNLSDAALGVLSNANSVANVLNNELIGTLHLILGIIHAGKTKAGRYLRSDALHEQGIERIVVQLIKDRYATTRPSYSNLFRPFEPFDLPYSPEVLAALHQADKITAEYGHEALSPEHLLLAVLSRENPDIHALANSLGLSPQRLRTLAAELLVVP